MKVLVTGGAGFIGSHLILRLVERNIPVVAFDIAEKPPTLAGVMDRITYVRGDLASSADLYRVMINNGITDVFHLGAILVGPCEENPIHGFQVNFQSTCTLLDAAVALNVNRFVTLSSISVFGRGVPEPVVDEAPKNPETVYGQTKLAAEHLLLWYARKRGLDTRALRFSWVFGPGRTTGITALYSSLILDAIARNEPLTIPNPDERGDWLYINDAVKALLLLFETDNPQQRIYNIAGGVHSIREVVELAMKICPGTQVIMETSGKSLSPYPVSYDDTPAREQFGWRPDYSIDAAVREHIKTVLASSR